MQKWKMGKVIQGYSKRDGVFMTKIEMWLDAKENVRQIPQSWTRLITKPINRANSTC
jgi:hypothetical protein